MQISNATIARLLFRLANLLEIAGEKGFKVKAYRMAADQTLDHPERIVDLFAAGTPLTTIPGVGAAIEQQILALLTKGSLPRYEELRATIPEELIELLSVRGLGATRVRTLHQELGIAGIDDLQEALEAGRLREAKGFTPRTEDRIRRSLYEYVAHRGRTLRALAEPFANKLLALLDTVPGVEQTTPAGSYRRGLETIGTLEIVVATNDPEAIRKALPKWEHFRNWSPREDEALGFLSEADLKIAVHHVEPQHFGQTLHQLTGSNEYLSTLPPPHPSNQREREGVRLGTSSHCQGAARPRLNADHDEGQREREGVRLGTGGKPQSEGLSGSKATAGLTADVLEQEYCVAAGIAWLPPELRSDTYALDEVRQSGLLDLVTLESIRGDLHMHTTHTDGRHTIEEMAIACRERGYEYLAITDHTRNVRVAGGLHPEEVPAYLEAIEAANDRVEGITILKGLEVDILADGSMDMPDEIMAQLDVVIAAIHSHFDQDVETVTKRVIAAMEHPLVQFVAHPSGRLVGQRSPLLLDFDRLFAAAQRTGTMFELNANPERLDLHDRHCRIARQMEIPVVINTDAHALRQLDNMPRGILQARRGMLTASDVLNSRPLPAMLKLLNRKRKEP